MEEGAKRRLAGATLLVVLLVIFLPMLLEKGAKSPVSEEEMSIPPRPDFDKDFDSSVFDKPLEPPVSAFPEYEEPPAEGPPSPQELPPPPLFEAPATTEAEDKTIPEPEAEAAPEAEPKFEIVQEPEPVSEQAQPPETAPIHKPLPVQPPARSQVSASHPSWVLQVAALQERARAYSLVQDLRAKGFPAYIEEATVDRKLWHRVRIGPEKERGRIESLAASLKAETGMNGQIQRYP